MREQANIAIPVSYSPDDKIKVLKNEERKLAAMGKFLQAQKVKDEIQKRQDFLTQKHRQIRDNNINNMLQELMDKQDKDIEQRKKQHETTLKEMHRERNRKVKELEAKHEKQVKEMKWMHEEEIRLIGT